MGKTTLQRRRNRVQRRFGLQNGRCYLCGQQLGRKRCTVDHVYPRAAYRFADGVGAGQSNFLLAHEKCNVEKGNREPWPCEVLYLAAVNLLLGFPETPLAMAAA